MGNINLFGRKQTSASRYRASKSSLARRIAQHWQMYLLLVLPIAYLVIFCYWPMVGAQIAFRKFKIRQGIWGSRWVGLDNFEKFFTSYYFPRTLGNTLRLSLYSIILGFPLPVVFALMLNAMRNRSTRKFAQTVAYMPHFISTVVLVGIITQIFNPRFGVYAQMYKLICGAGNNVPNVLLNASAFPHVYVLSGIWQNLGWDTIIYTAALAAVDPSLHEAATIDGASRMKRILYVDFPAIVPTISIMLILRFGAIMGIGFDKAYLLQNDANLVTSEVISTYSYKVSFQSSNMDYSYSTAIGLFNSVVGLVMLAVTNYISKRITHEGLW